MKFINIKGKKIPAIALGTWSWGTGTNGGDQVFGNEYNAEMLRPVFNKAMEQGLNLWDTAAVYGMGASEAILGEFIREHKNKIVVSTKFTPLGMQNQNSMSEWLEKSLERLGMDSTDIYWIHNPGNVEKWTKELIPLMKSGKIKHAGVSNHNLEEIKLAASILEKEGLELSAVQNHYSLLYRASEQSGIIEWCNKNDVVFFSYMVLEQGALTGRYDSEHPFKSGTRRGEAFTPEVLKGLDGLIDTMKQIAKEYDVDAAAIAMAWAIAKGTVPIIGVTKTAHIDGAMAALNVELKDDEIAVLEKAAKDTGISIRASWEGEMK